MGDRFRDRLGSRVSARATSPVSRRPRGKATAIERRRRLSVNNDENRQCTHVGAPPMILQWRCCWLTRTPRKMSCVASAPRCLACRPQRSRTTPTLVASNRPPGFCKPRSPTATKFESVGSRSDAGPEESTLENAQPVQRAQSLPTRYAHHRQPTLRLCLAPARESLRRRLAPSSGDLYTRKLQERLRHCAKGHATALSREQTAWKHPTDGDSRPATVGRRPSTARGHESLKYSLV
jgi:hypothetical protein